MIIKKQSFGFQGLCLMAVLLGPGTVFAESLRCDGRIVSLGDEKRDVAAICGPPSFVETYQEEKVIKVYRVGPKCSQNKRGEDCRECDGRGPEDDLISARSILVIVEEWTYNFGSSRFIQTLTFKNDDLVSIKDGGYGFDKIAQDFNVRKGDSKAVIWIKYGPPADIKKNLTSQIRVAYESEGDYCYEEKFLTPVLEEEWIYDLGPEKYLQKLNFINNRLVWFRNLRTKGTKTRLDQ